MKREITGYLNSYHEATEITEDKEHQKHLKYLLSFVEEFDSKKVKITIEEVED